MIPEKMKDGGLPYLDTDKLQTPKWCADHFLLLISIPRHHPATFLLSYSESLYQNLLNLWTCDDVRRSLDFSPFSSRSGFEV